MAGVAAYKRERKHQQKLGCSMCPANKGCNASRKKHGTKKPKYKNKVRK